MLKLVPRIVAVVKPCRTLTIAVILPFAVGALPARAQDIFGFSRLFSPPVAQSAPAFQPLEYRAIPSFEQPKVRPKPKAVPVAQTAIKMPEKAKALGEIANPVPDLLADSTLRHGDMVMFPDGLRVFTGQAGGQHKLADFDAVSQAGRAIAPSTRELVASLRPTTNAAWSTDSVRSGGKLAANTKAAETTGSVTLKGR